MKKTQDFIKAAIVIAIALAFIMPSAAVITNDTSEKVYTNTLNENQTPIEISSAQKQTMPNQVKLADPLIFPGVGDDRYPGITVDGNGFTVLTWTNSEDITASRMTLWFSDEPSVPESWIGWTISLSGAEDCVYWDTAWQDGDDAWSGLFGTFISLDTEAVGGYRITDITSDPSLWEYYTWNGGAPECSYACVDDNNWFQDLNYPEYTGPFHMYIYREIYEPDYDISDCPICFHTGVTSDGGVGYFDGQSKLWTAPASDPDMANLDDRFHITWQYYNETTDVGQIVWKKIVPADEPDVEYTPFQDYVAEGAHPSVAAYEDVVAIIYEDDLNISVAYSDDQGETFDFIEIAEGVYPDIEAFGGILYATYIHEGNLYLTTSGDGGASWAVAEQINDMDGTVEEEENSVDIHRGGICWVDNRGDDLDIVWIKLPTESPEITDINGPAEVKVDEESEFFATAEDPQGDDYYLMFDWGDNSTPEWTTESFASGTEGSDAHTWTVQGDYEVRVKAKDSAGHESDWSKPIPVTVPRSKAVTQPTFLELLEQFFPEIYRIIVHILG